ncbi:hypothetical protein Tco_0480094, partial [Tanacetum coccineum]
MVKECEKVIYEEKVRKEGACIQTGEENAKPRPTLDAFAFDDLDDDLAHGMEYMDIEEAVNEGRKSKETEELNVTHDTVVLEKRG